MVETDLLSVLETFVAVIVKANTYQAQKPNKVHLRMVDKHWLAAQANALEKELYFAVCGDNCSALISSMQFLRRKQPVHRVSTLYWSLCIAPESTVCTTDVHLGHSEAMFSDRLICIKSLWP